MHHRNRPGGFSAHHGLQEAGDNAPSVYQGTGFYPAKDTMDRGREWESKEEKVYAVSVAFGFAYADVTDVGATIVVVTDDDQGLANEVAQDIVRLQLDPQGALRREDPAQDQRGGEESHRGRARQT